MEYNEALEYIHSIPKFVRPLGNAMLEGLLKQLGNPQKELKYVHIAGTNGKGSTAASIASILESAGYRTGLFTSPFIEVFNERIQINRENISDNKLAEYTERVKKASEESGCAVSEFAFITATAFLYFRDMQCDIVILETGMGGRLDATNIIEKPLVSVITSISLDHIQYLGNTIEEITAEKCGIIKPNGIVVTYPNEKVMDIIEKYAEQNSAKLIKAEKAQYTAKGFIYKEKTYPLALKGTYQPQNAAVALETIFALRSSGMNISDEAVITGLKKVRWPARFEFITDSIVIDGGHNIDGIHALKQSLESDGRSVILVMAMMEDKNYSECAAEISECAEYFIATEINMPRCLSSEQLLKCSSVPGEAVHDPREAVRKAISIAGDDKLVCICGSLYLAGEVRKMFSK